MLILVLAGILTGQAESSPAWRPPKDVDAHAVLKDANRDARAGDHEAALAKFLWFHHNALKHEPALAGVRLSFALSYWLDLARVYSPALDALTKTRDDALREFKGDPRGREAIRAFRDFESINKKLTQESLTARVFEELDADDPAAAERVFRFAQPALIMGKKYALCAKYLKPEEDLLFVARDYQRGRRDAHRYGPEYTEYVERAFTHRVTTLVALLVLNGRQQEAERIAQQARLEWDDAGFQASIGSALRGQVPEPWP